MPNFICYLVAAMVFATPTHAQSCGKANVAMRANRIPVPGQRIVGGVEAKPHSHPWIVSLQRNQFHFCGGSLIRVGDEELTDLVLTAAHCLSDDTTGITVTAGAHDLDQQTGTEQTVSAVKNVRHEQYGNNQENDIGIIKLEKPIKFGQYAAPVCLPAPGEKVADGTVGTLAGWGRTQEGGSASTVLMQVGVPVTSKATCEAAYGPLPDSQFCAAIPQGGKDSCQGDSGGPFVFSSANGGFVLQGVVSYGIGCARPGYPGVYTRVSSYIDWIQAKVQLLSGANSSSTQAPDTPAPDTPPPDEENTGDETPPPDDEVPSDDTTSPDEDSPSDGTPSQDDEIPWDENDAPDEESV